ncbi:hypothetical protein LCGC14_1378260 [marine sediment metagenome]|uniref:Uncharacterized protein n=1 Tax=marine sediment metagenome TaxID=412755 RepID=A0A0F9K3F0_9ZZZZ
MLRFLMHRFCNGQGLGVACCSACLPGAGVLPRCSCCRTSISTPQRTARRKTPPASGSLLGPNRSPRRPWTPPARRSAAYDRRHAPTGSALAPLRPESGHLETPPGSGCASVRQSRNTLREFHACPVWPQPARPPLAEGEDLSGSYRTRTRTSDSEASQFEGSTLAFSGSYGVRLGRSSPGRA